MYKSDEGALGIQRAELNVALIQKSSQGGSSRNSMHYIGLDVHKKTISNCVKDVSGQIQSEGIVPATRADLDRWMKALPQP